PRGQAGAVYWFGTCALADNVAAGPDARFFFQAEDGIRDLIVTGVQTCALPISSISSLSYAPAGDTRRAPERERDKLCLECAGLRSEERRVGKECRSRGGREQHKEKRSTLLHRGIFLLVADGLDLVFVDVLFSVR